MFPVVIFRASAHTGTNDIIVAGTHSVDNLTVRYSGQTITLTADGRDDYVSKLTQIAKYGVVEITG